MAILIATEITAANGKVAYAQTVNISRAGLQIECDRVLRDMVFPGGQPVSPDRQPGASLRLRLPRPGGGADWIGVRCRGIIFRRVGADAYRLGLQYTRFEEADGYERLASFIEGAYRGESARPGGA